MRHADAVVVLARRLDRAAIRAMERCRLILTLSVGYDCVDLNAATERLIPVSNTPAYCTDEVATHALTLLLALARKLPLILPRTRAGEWDYNFTRPLYGLRGRLLGIIGLGRIGRALVPKARALGLRVAAYDPYVDDDLFALLGVQPCYELEPLLREADYLSIHAPLTAETRRMIDAAALALMKPTALLINTARGPIVDEAALAAALREGRLGGAGIDVLETEPPAPDNPLLCPRERPGHPARGLVLRGEPRGGHGPGHGRAAARAAGQAAALGRQPRGVRPAPRPTGPLTGGGGAARFDSAARLCSNEV